MFGAPGRRFACPWAVLFNPFGVKELMISSLLERTWKYCNSDNSRVDRFLAKVRIQGNWPSQTASLPPRPPMQGAGYGPPPYRHRKHGVGGGRQCRNILSVITLQRHRPARHPATMTGHRQPEFAIGKVLVRLKVTRLTWECNKASFVSPRNCPLFLVEKRPF